MSVRLSRRSFDYAQQLIREGKFKLDQRDDWSEHQPSAREENEFIEANGIEEFGRWHLGFDDEANPETKRRYKYPYGDFQDVHRCAVLSAESRAGQRDHLEVEKAVAHLHGMLEAQR
jgi:hypothetical protein